MNQPNNVKITNLMIKKNNYIVTYQLNDELFDVSLDEELIVKHRILKDKVFEVGDWEEILNDALNSNAFNQALKYASYQFRTNSEIKAYLENNEVSDDVIHQVIKRLSDSNILDDKRFANKFVEDYASRLKGPLLIKAKLEQKGISTDMIDQALKNYQTNEQSANILSIIEKEHNRLITYPVSHQKELIIQKLLRDGYHYQQIQTEIDAFMWQSTHLKRLVDDFAKVQMKTKDKIKIVQKLMQKGYNYQEIKALIEEESNEV